MTPTSSWLPRLGVLLALAFILGVPLAFRPEAARNPEGAAKLVIITPHNEQIRTEFARGFDAWHRRTYNQPAAIDWRVPGGTTEIRRLLIAQYTEALKSGRLTSDGKLAPGAEPMPYDLLFGGGTFEHGQMKLGIKVELPDPVGASGKRDVSLTMSIPAGHDQAKLDEWFGTPNWIGNDKNFLYDPGDASKNDPGQYWIGTAVSGFGIIFNRELLVRLGKPEPTSWNDMCDADLQGWVALADPRQSGSVATTYESILNSYGWDEGWKILRRMCANARYFTYSSQKVPLDVAQGQAAMGVAIDFYGRYQSQAYMKAGETVETSRVGYIDPPGVVYIDPDPISLLRSSGNPEIARRFLEFVLSEQGQAIWNFHARGPRAESAGTPDDFGPAQFEIRRMPIRRVMFEKHWDRLIDKVNPYEVASKAPNRGWRSAIGPMMGAFGIDTHEDLRAAWSALAAAKARGADPDLIARAEALLDAFPGHTIPAKGDQPAQTLAFDEKNYRSVRGDWRDAEADGRWPRIRMEYTGFFRQNYRQIVRMLSP